MQSSKQADGRYIPPPASSDSLSHSRAGIFSAGPDAQNGSALPAAVQDLAPYDARHRGRQQQQTLSAVGPSASGLSHVLRQALPLELPVATKVQPLIQQY